MTRLDQYFADVAGIRAHGTSRHGWVTVTRNPDGEIAVKIRPGMLRQCDNRQVNTEIGTALSAALADHRNQYRQLRIAYFGSALGATRVPPEDSAPTVRGQI